MVPLKINLGSGDRPIPGFVNVDALPEAPQVDVVADLTQRLPFDDECAELIYASHVLEHFETAAIPPLLADCARVLSPNGKLLIAVPDLELIARLIRDRPGWFTPPHNPWLGALYGGQKDEYDFHKTGFTAVWLTGLLHSAGFRSVTRVMTFDEIGIADASFSPAPFGENVSLNIRARKSGALSGELFSPGPLERLLAVLDRGLTLGLRISSYLRNRLALSRRRELERRLTDSEVQS
jgi:predicted SAM-dependent methyltransferase